VAITTTTWKRTKGIKFFGKQKRKMIEQ